jgi:hypothetical protein
MRGARVAYRAEADELIARPSARRYGVATNSSSSTRPDTGKRAAPASLDESNAQAGEKRQSGGVFAAQRAGAKNAHA